MADAVSSPQSCWKTMETNARNLTQSELLWKKICSWGLVADVLPTRCPKFNHRRTYVQSWAGWLSIISEGPCLKKKMCTVPKKE